MTTTAIDHVIIATADLEEATEPWRRLGMTPARGTKHPHQGTENAVVFIGDGPPSMFYLEFLTIFDPATARLTPHGRKLGEAIDHGPSIFRLVLETNDLARVAAVSREAAIPYSLEEVLREDGSKICDVATLANEGETTLHPRFIQYVLGRPERFAARRRRGLFSSTFDLLRLDHLAAIPDDLDGATAVWRDVYGAEMSGEVTGPGILIRQMRIGDATVELLGPSGSDSRLAGAAVGLRSMLACEVGELDLAVRTARERGFTPSEPSQGILPGTRTATIPADELSGVALQLLEYE